MAAFYEIEDIAILSPDTKLNRGQYILKDFIGMGGFGITYHALWKFSSSTPQTAFERPIREDFDEPKQVVIKELYRSEWCIREDDGDVVATNKVTNERFKKLKSSQFKEGQRLVKLQHAHIVEAIDIFEDKNTVYLVLQHIQGRNMHALVTDSGPIAWKKSLDYMLQVTRALVHIHEKQMLHLDIAPNNIMVHEERNHITLIDFGISLTYTDGKLNPNSTSIFGNKGGFSCAEQYFEDNLKDFKPYFDTYSAVATLYVMLSGKQPPHYTNINADADCLLLPESLGEQVCEVLNEIIKKGMNFKVTPRYESADKLLAALKEAVEFLIGYQQVKDLADRGAAQDALILYENKLKKFARYQSIQKVVNECSARVKLEARKQEQIVKPIVDRGNLKVSEPSTNIIVGRPILPEFHSSRNEAKEKELENDKINKGLFEAEIYFKSGNLRNALNAVEALLVKYPANVLIKQRVELYQKALKDAHSRAQEKSLAAKIAVDIDAGMLDVAKSDIEKLRQLNPENASLKSLKSRLMIAEERVLLARQEQLKIQEAKDQEKARQEDLARQRSFLLVQEEQHKAQELKDKEAHQEILSKEKAAFKEQANQRVINNIFGNRRPLDRQQIPTTAPAQPAPQVTKSKAAQQKAEKEFEESMAKLRKTSRHMNKDLSYWEKNRSSIMLLAILLMLVIPYLFYFFMNKG